MTYTIRPTYTSDTGRTCKTVQGFVIYDQDNNIVTSALNTSGVWSKKFFAQAYVDKLKEGRCTPSCQRVACAGCGDLLSIDFITVDGYCNHCQDGG